MEAVVTRRGAGTRGSGRAGQLGRARRIGLVVLCSGCCCSRVGAPAPGHAAPLPAALVLPVPEPVAAAHDTVTQLEMRNVDLHVDDSIHLRVHRLRGTVRDLGGQHIIDLDDKHRLLFQLAYAEIGLSMTDLSDLLNRYVFGYRGSPLRGLVVRADGAGIRQTGVLRKVVDIPFDMRATLSVTPDGLIRLHPTSMKISTIPGLGLLHALGITLQKLMDVRGAKGVQVRGNDLLLDPLAILPPPRIVGRLSAIRVDGPGITQVFGATDAPGAAPLAPPITAPNYVYFRGGTVRFGKLYMVETALEAIDADPADPFDFYLDYYQTQLMAGEHRTMPDGALVAWMPDFSRLARGQAPGLVGSAPRPRADSGATAAPPATPRPRADSVATTRAGGRAPH